MAVSSSKALIGRVVPEYSRFFEEEYIPEQDDSLDVFEIESRDGKIVLRGNNGVSIASAFNYYLEKYCNAEVSWNTEKVELPEPLPVIGEKIRKTTPYTFRHYFNYCTFNYSASWWDWKRWQKEIDFMAMHGINMPLALTGQNIVWYKVYKDLGFSDKDLQEFFTGPDYFIWFWMGNMDGWGGPLSKHFMKFHKRLQKRILARERGLGMTPILPSFTGHVPPAFPQRFPDAKLGIVQWGEGCNTTPPTYVLNPEEPMFQEIGRRFLREQTRLFGTDHLYSADTFNEMTPPTNDPAYLNSIGRNVYDVMTSVDPEAVWVMQGWMFFDRAWFWQPAQMKALFDAAPQDRLVILDLWCEKYPMWSLTDAFYGEQWIWNMLHNFGGRQSIYGDMETVARAPAEALHNPASGKMKGIGLTMEAIEQNPAIYSLMLENVWNDTAVDLDSWIRDYPVRRYGVEDADAVRAWEILRNTAYSAQLWYGNVSIIAARPTLEEEGNWVFTQCPYDKGEFLQAADALVAAADELRTSDGYRYDVVNVVRQALSNYSNDVQRRLAAAYEAGDRTAWDAARDEFTALLDDLDRLLGSHPSFLLGTWLESARKLGRNAAEKDLFEMNARDIITLWTGKECTIHEYASKEWSGLIRGFYKERWLRFFSQIEQCWEENRDFDAAAFDAEIAEWEWQWVNSHEIYPSTASGDCVELSVEIYDSYRQKIKALYNESN
ncbi:MAG: alpha-N-acetylglucosaminidase [Bacteroidales bacterium]|nr:alpha-N-acetylglucosaminidase [Bacteroidales bacterium]